MQMPFAAMLFLLMLATAASTPLPINVDSVDYASASRARIIQETNTQASTWQAAVSNRFKGTTYSFLLSQGAGVLGGNPAENEAGLPMKTVDDIIAYRGVTPIPSNFSSLDRWGKVCPILAEIRDQSACGSCYAVSGASAATDRFCIAHNGTISPRLSEVDLMSCCKTCAGSNGGCDGGTPSKCWDYMTSQGITSGGAYGDYSQCLAYPFPECEHHTTGSKPTCSPTPYFAPTCFWACDPNSTSKISYDASQAAHKFGTSYKIDKNVAAIQTDIMHHGPVQASMFLVPEFEVYKSGIFTTQSKAYIGAHAVKIVGWGTDAGVEYWNVQNSWNSDWGEKGYFRIERGKDVLAIESGVVAGTVATW